ncbi:MAG: hypothetical protein HWE08_12350 [Alphaproteobacteria bacterium]|nr:hypothetical protein [Alphaproteobacteria bacterium]
MTTNGKAEPRVELADLTAATFEKYTDKAFEVEVDNVKQAVTLVDCTEKPDNMGPDSTRTPFTLMLRAEVDDENPLQHAHSFLCTLRGLEEGEISNLSVERIMRPPRLPGGVYFQVVFG